MLKKKNNILLIFILFIVSLSLITAFYIQYALGHIPCKLCLYQRIPYIISILLIVQILIFSKYQKITLLALAIIFFCSSILAFYHFGIEQGFFNELSVCGNENISENPTKEEILEQLKKNAISCKDATFKVLGLSLASINSILSFMLGIIFTRLLINYEKN